MTNLQPDTPIVVPESALYTQLSTLVGQALPIIGTGLSSYGVMDAQHWAVWAGLIPIILSAGWRLWAATRNHDQKVLMAHAAPDSIAVVKP